MLEKDRLAGTIRRIVSDAIKTERQDKLEAIRARVEELRLSSMLDMILNDNFKAQNIEELGLLELDDLMHRIERLAAMRETKPQDQVISLAAYKAGQCKRR